MKISAPVRAAALAAAALSLTACLSIRVEKDVREADRYFRKAYAEIAAIEASPRHGSRHPHRLCVLVHDSGQGELVRVSVPMWLVNAGLDIGAKASEHERGEGIAGRYDLEWSAVRDLDRYGPGLLVSVEEESARVLVWLK